jgi:hypothetical protein
MFFILWKRVAKEVEKVTRDELILGLFNEKDPGKEGSNEDFIRKFTETYKDHADLITKATEGDAKALRRLRWICGLRVIT